MAPRLRGLRGRRARSLPVAPGGAGARISALAPPQGLARPLLRRCREPGIAGGAAPLPRPPLGDARARLASPTHQLLPGEPNFCGGLGLAARERRAARVVAGAALPRGDDLPTLALGAPVLPCRGGRRLAARQRPSAPAGHVSGARARLDAWGERAPCRPRPSPDRAQTLQTERFPPGRAGGAGCPKAPGGVRGCPRRIAAGTRSPACGVWGLCAFHLRLSPPPIWECACVQCACVFQLIVGLEE